MHATIAVTFAAALVVAPAVAATDDTNSSSVSWSVTPAGPAGADGRSWVELELDPGEQTTDHVAVRNLGDTPTTFALNAADGYFTDTGRFSMLPAGSASIDAGTWINVAESVEVAPGDTAIVPFTVTVPDDARPGDHAAGIAASISSVGTGAGGAAIQVDSRVGFRVVTTVAGELEAGVTLSDVDVRYHTSWNPFLPGRVTADYTVANSGNVQITFADGLNGAAQQRGDLLPGEKRASAATRTAWPLFYIPVDITASATADNVDPATSTMTVWVWAVPWPQLLGLLGVSLIAFAIVANRRRGARHVERLIAEAREEGRRSVSK